MSTQNYLNFKKVEVVSTSNDENEILSKTPFKSIMRNATQKFKNWKKSLAEDNQAITENDIKQFCINYLAQVTKNTPGACCYITVDPAVADTRERPYKIEDVKNEKGKRKYSTVYQFVNEKTGELLDVVNGTKAKAKERLRELYLDGLKDDVTVTYNKQVTEGEPVAFRGKYTPSKASHPGTYIVFGIED